MIFSLRWSLTFEAVVLCAAQWLSASVLPTSGHCGRSTNSQLLHREIAREGLSLQSLFRLQVSKIDLRLVP